jgi:hypothetical protein
MRSLPNIGKHIGTRNRKEREMGFLKSAWDKYMALPVPDPIKYIVAAAVVLIAAQYVFNFATALLG